jgi:ACT domain-containing protein
MTTKKELNHYDLFGEKLCDDDIVIAADGIRGQLKVCKIVKQTDKMIRVSPIDKVSYRRTSFLRYPRHLIKVDSDKAVEYILTLEL